MLIKRARALEAQLELLEPGDRVKTAGAMPEVQRYLDSLTPHPAYTYALVNAMGYSEFYGTNSNADWYGYVPEMNFNGLLHAWPDIGDNLETDKMKGRDWPYGYPCFYGASVYAHHRNTCPVELGFGDVTYVYANPHMKRIELLMRVHNEEARKKGHLNIVERIRAGERCDVSMGAKIPFDQCSICTDWDAVDRARKTFDPLRHKHWGLAVLEQHKKKAIRGIAVTSPDYCTHIRSQKNQVMPDGRKAYMINAFPRFFDISCVFIGADRTARVMWHLTDSFRDDAPIPQPMRTARLNLGDLLSSKVAAKQAEMKKEIPGGVVSQVLTDSDTAPEVRFDLMKQDPSRLLSTAAALGILLSPREFDRVLGGPGRDFSTGTSEVSDGMTVRPDLIEDDLLRAMKEIAPERSAYRPYVEPRIKHISARIVISSEPHHVEEQKLASLYNGYRLSILENAEKLAERSRGYLVEDPLDPEAGASSLGPLLLSLPSVIQFLAAHLRGQRDDGKQLGAMASILADSSTFRSLATLGTGIRIAMTVETTGLLPALLRLLETKT